jgi:MoxR-like ATPase
MNPSTDPGGFEVALATSPTLAMPAGPTPAAEPGVAEAAAPHQPLAGASSPAAMSHEQALEFAFNMAARLTARMRAAVVGRDDVVDHIAIALLADGHVLLEDYPGSGKTTLAKALGDAIVPVQRHDHIVSMRRVQFTPDLLPSDVTGTTIFDPATNRFHFRPGPVFAHVLLADEINRTSPKVQAALLEAMGEKQATIDNETHVLDDLFMVIATQNPLDLAGTFPLPAAQLDRFLFKIRMKHIDRASELTVLQSIQQRRDDGGRSKARVSRDEIVLSRKLLQAHVHVAPAILEALVDFATFTRDDERVNLGVSTRSLVQAVPALQAAALMAHRDFVSADDIVRLADALFTHRLDAAAGISDPSAIVIDCAARAVESLQRRSLRGGAR